MSGQECQFIHAAFPDDWGRCPHPDQVKRYRCTRAGEVYSAWYCDFAAQDCREHGWTVEAAPDPFAAVLDEDWPPSKPEVKP